jgi:hypothetical protein
LQLGQKFGEAKRSQLTACFVVVHLHLDLRRQHLFFIIKSTMPDSTLKLAQGLSLTAQRVQVIAINLDDLRPYLTGGQCGG